MSWDKSKTGKRYYSQSKRVGDKILRTYIGGGPLAQVIALEDAKRREERRRLRADLESHLAIIASIDRFCAEVDLVMARHLSGKGYHQHNRGEWRKKRSLKQPLSPEQIVVETRARHHAKPMPPADPPAAPAPAVQRQIEEPASPAPEAAPASAVLSDTGLATVPPPRIGGRMPEGQEGGLFSASPARPCGSPRWLCTLLADLYALIQRQKKSEAEWQAREAARIAEAEAAREAARAASVREDLPWWVTGEPAPATPDQPAAQTPAPHVS